MAHFLKGLSVILMTLSITGCQIPYLLNSAYHQGKILSKRKPIDKVLAADSVEPLVRENLLLVNEVKEFAQKRMGWKSLKNYSSYVELGRPYVSYIVTASPKNKLTPYLWWFPIVGHVPYKGYFNLESAQKEAARLSKKDLDTYLRGVSAYSTLGWFRDPILSSMAHIQSHNFVNVLFHELTHANLYLKSSVDFNERVATFLGDLATEQFYIEREGSESPAVKVLRDEHHDTLLYSQFIAREIKALQTWYDSNPAPKESERQEMFEAIKVRFINEVLPIMKTKIYSYFAQAKINNAFLQQNSIYYGDMDQYYKLHLSLGGDLRTTFEFLKSLEKSKDPEKQLQSKFEELPPS